MQPSRLPTDAAESLSQHRNSSIWTTEVEQALYHHLRHRDDISAPQLLGNYLCLAIKIAEGYADCGIALKELIGEACSGLMRAVCQFDPDRGVRLTTYATWHVRQAIHEYILEMTALSLVQLVQLQDAPVALQESGGPGRETAHKTL